MSPGTACVAAVKLYCGPTRQAEPVEGAPWFHAKDVRLACSLTW